MSDFREKLVSMGKGHASLEEVLESLDQLITQTPDEAVPARKLVESAKRGGLSETMQQKMLAQIDAAVGAGATVLTGGAGHHDNFVTPTVLTGVTEEMDIGTVETFGPVACVTRVSSIDEAVDVADGMLVWAGKKKVCRVELN